MTQMPLIAADLPPQPIGIDIRLTSCTELLAAWSGTADLVHADAPWSYRHTPPNGAAENHYGGMTVKAIAADIGAAHAPAADDCYLLFWCTWPILWEWFEASGAGPWRYVSGGVWAKPGRPGIGHHWRGNSEPLLLYAKGKPKPQPNLLENLFTYPRGAHSEKPIGALRTLVHHFCPPGGLVLDLYAGRAPLARACVAESRGYLGAEIDAERHQEALGLLAGRVGL